MSKIKIISGWTNPGGSTVAFINLCNLFNENGLDCTFYGPHDWHLDKCKAGRLQECAVNEEGENLIVHFLKFPERPESSNKVILACHEKQVFPIKEIKPFWDDIVYVSESQMKWQEVTGEIIPNIIFPLIEREKSFVSAGAIGSIDRNKNTHVSIERALADGHSEMLLYGLVTDEVYYSEEVKKYVESGYAKIMKHENDKQKMYDTLSDVYHSSLSETFNFIKPECEKAGVRYHGLDSAESGAGYWTSEDILSKWKELLKV